MTDGGHHRRGTTLTTLQKRLLLWLPLIGFWLVMVIVSRRPEEGAGHDWTACLISCVLGTAVYVPLWFALLRMVQAPKVTEGDAEGAAEPKSRAAAIYGDKKKGAG